MFGLGLIELVVLAFLGLPFLAVFLTRSRRKKLAGRGADPDEFYGLGGWLVLVGFGLITNPLRIWKSIDEMSEVLGEVTRDRPDLVWLVELEIAANWVFLAAALLLIFFFFRMSAKFPLTAIGVWVAGFLFNLVDLQLAISTGAVANLPVESIIRAIAPSALLVAVWTPYLLRSKRVKATFTRRWHGHVVG